MNLKSENNIIWLEAQGDKMQEKKNEQNLRDDCLVVQYQGV